MARELSNVEMRPDKYDEGNLRKEIADVILESMILGTTVGMDIGAGLDKKLDELYKRHGYKDIK